MLPELALLVRLSMYQPQIEAANSVALATHSFSMSNRYGNDFVNEVFKENMLLSMSYMSGTVKSKADINWGKVESPFRYEFRLEPGQIFAFHDGVLPKYSKNIVQTTNAHFYWNEGFKSDGYLVGDGVCQLASLINWVALDAKLDVYAPNNHNFANIPDVPKEYGVAIMSPNPSGNLYITNNYDKTVTFVFNYDGDNLAVSVHKAV